DVVGTAGLEVQADAVGAQALGVLPVVEHQLAIHVQAHAIVGRGLDAVAAAHRRQQLAGPADAEAVVGHGVVRTGLATRHQVVGGRAAVPAEGYLLVHAHQHRRAGQVLVAEVLAAQATLGGTGLRTQVLRLDQRGGGRVVATLDQVDATRVHHVDARRRLADAA